MAANSTSDSIMQRWLLAALLVSACPYARAAEHGFYLGAGVNRSEIDAVARGPVRTLDFDETAWRAIAGIRPLDFLAAELTYTDLGEENQWGQARAEVTTLSASVIGLLPLPFVDIYGKAGIVRWEVDGSAGDQCIGPGGPCVLMLLVPRSDSGRDAIYGAGAQVKLKRMAIRFEYETFDIDDTEGAEVYTVGVTWTF